MHCGEIIYIAIFSTPFTHNDWPKIRDEIYWIWQLDPLQECVSKNSISVNRLDLKDQRTPNISFTEIACLYPTLVILITFTCFVTVTIPYGSKKQLYLHLILHNTINHPIGQCQGDVIHCGHVTRRCREILLRPLVNQGFAWRQENVQNRILTFDRCFDRCPSFQWRHSDVVTSSRCPCYILSVKKIFLTQI